jgi:type III pantothenate kinase
MKNLAIDIGNSRIKIGVFEKNVREESAFSTFATLRELEIYLQSASRAGIGQAILSSTAQNLEDSETGKAVLQLLEKSFFFVRLSHTTPIPIQNAYTTPQTLGRDRLAGAVAANFLFPNQNCLVVDAGTCVTYDFVNAENTFLGGNISPGLQMRLRAMHHFTAKLPLLTFDTGGGAFSENLVGQNTQQAMQTGAAMGLIAEVEGFVKRYKNAFGNNLQLILTGGDGNFLFQNVQKTKKYLEPDLILQGLNQILNHNFYKKS